MSTPIPKRRKTDNKYIWLKCCVDGGGRRDRVESAVWRGPTSDVSGCVSREWPMCRHPRSDKLHRGAPPALSAAGFGVRALDGCAWSVGSTGGPGTPGPGLKCDPRGRAGKTRRIEARRTLPPPERAAAPVVGGAERSSHLAPSRGLVKYFPAPETTGRGTINPLIGDRTNKKRISKS